MNKSARLNDMMIFLNDKSYFNLKDLMKEYGISKSTALRDIQALEELGMPLFSEAGRNGRYGLLKNRLLSPIVFTVDEMYALYFAMLTLKAYESTPFHLRIEKLKQKFATCLSDHLLQTIDQMEAVLTFEATKHYNNSPLLKAILEAIIEEKVCTITYQKEVTKEISPVQFFKITSSFGQWYVTGFHFESQQARVFRCDRIINLTVCNEVTAKPLAELLNDSDHFFKAADAIDFEVQLTAKGVDKFYKENYPSMELIKVNGQYIIKGFYNKREENYIADYFISYGQLIQAIYPNQLKELIQERISELSQYYDCL